MFLNIVFVLCIGSVAVYSQNGDTCVADNSLWLAFEYYPCSKLQDPTDRLGIYRTRKERCEDPLTDCCVTCEKVRKEYTCEDVNNGVTLGDGTYACAKLTDVNDQLGIYRDRASICQQQTTQCCVTCKDILNSIGPHCELTNTGVYIADGAYSCSKLLDVNDKLGIYKNRKKICDDKQTQCCITCQTVLKEIANSTSSEATTAQAPTTTLKTIIVGNPVLNQDCERHVWLAGGAYDCGYLLDPSNKYGIYQKRHQFCSNGVADCCISCSRVRQEPVTDMKPSTETVTSTTPITTSKPVPGGNVITKACERYVWIAGGAYECSSLLDPSNKYGIYQKRRKFCQNGIADCCITCSKVLKETVTDTKPSTETVTSTTPITTSKPVAGGNVVTKACERYVWIAGGAYECSNLLDPSNKYGIYQKRQEFCQNGIADCCITCSKVLKGSQTSVTLKITAGKTKRPTTQIPASVCKDEWIFISGQYLDCSRLTDTSNSYDIYRRRVELCQAEGIKCCKTCQKIKKGTPSKPAGEKNINENTVFKPPRTVQIQNEASLEATRIASNQERLNEASRAIQEAFQNFFFLLSQFRAGVQQMNGRMINNRS